MRTVSALLIDGKFIASKKREQVAAGAAALVAATGVRPGLAVVLVGDDPASQVYVRNKERQALAAGFHSVVERLPASTTQDELLTVVDRFNNDPLIHALLVQLPLPRGLDEQAVLQAIRPEKDADGLHPVNVGRLHAGLPAPLPCTPAGVMELLHASGIEPAGKRAVVIGRSNIVGKPMAALLLQAHATVTICHSRTADLAAVCHEADILVAAVGRARLVTPDYVKPGAAVIDVGMNRVDGVLCGDVDFDAVRAVAGHITPVPGGVGPMTIAMLLDNTLRAAQLAAGAR
jgi:methylenetetrahydrofolate dehydrogenase (NADP+)/methenyltetrahydrofolate cyclohydrolase